MTQFNSLASTFVLLPSVCGFPCSLFFPSPWLSLCYRYLVSDIGRIGLYVDRGTEFCNACNDVSIHICHLPGYNVSLA
jgi:hypothetical protein